MKFTKQFLLKHPPTDRGQARMEPPPSPPPQSSSRTPSRSNLGLWLGLGFLVAIAAALFNFYSKRPALPVGYNSIYFLNLAIFFKIHEKISLFTEICNDQTLWTVEELTAYNGTDERLPILLGILGYFICSCSYSLIVID